MIIRFSLENWMSFRDPVTFSMVASEERQHSDRVPELGQYKTRILPVAAIYGGNASGKSNFVAALGFAKRLVTRGPSLDNPINVRPFLLDADCSKRPSRFTFELLIDETVYRFGFAVTREAVIEEKLVRVTGTEEKTLYDRQGGKVALDDSLSDSEFLEFAFRGTQDNQLFLANAVSQKVEEHFRPIYDWFDVSLNVIMPSTHFERFDDLLDEKGSGHAAMNDVIKQLDAGITRLGSEEIEVDKFSFPQDVKDRLEKDLKGGGVARLLGVLPGQEPVLVIRKGNKLVVPRLTACHPAADGGEVKFEMQMESDGTRRVIHLLPAFLGLSTKGSRLVFVVDEIDRSIHTLLMRKLLDAYLGSCSTDTRSQLLLTTHDALLMDQRLFRRDEMWVTERDADGASSLFSFSEYEGIDKDPDIRKSYLQGRLGGIPRILLGDSFTASGVAEENEEYD